MIESTAKSIENSKKFNRRSQIIKYTHLGQSELMIFPLNCVVKLKLWIVTRKVFHFLSLVCCFSLYIYSPPQWTHVFCLTVTGASLQNSPVNYLQCELKSHLISTPPFLPQKSTAVNCTKTHRTRRAVLSFKKLTIFSLQFYNFLLLRQIISQLLTRNVCCKVQIEIELHAQVIVFDVNMRDAMKECQLLLPRGGLQIGGVPQSRRNTRQLASTVKTVFAFFNPFPCRFFLYFSYFELWHLY